MKKFLLTLAIAVGTTVFSYSQFYGNGFLCFDCESSFEAGIISSSLSGRSDTSQKIGFYIGFYQYKYVSEKVSLRFGTSYNNLGAKIKDFDSPLVFHSINFPLSVHYFPAENYQVFAGGELGTNFFGKLPNSDSDGFMSDFSLHDNFTLFDASLIFGAGYILAENIDINLKYNLGVTNVSKNEDFNWKKNWLTLSVGYTFRD